MTSKPQKLVFPDNYVAESLKQSKRLEIEIASSPGYSRFRKQVEDWVSLVPPECRTDVIARLRNGTKRTWDKYHELAVGYSLRCAGFAPVYEGQTVSGFPVDWFVPQSSTAPAFLVEVFSASYDGDNDIDASVVKRLQNLLRNTKVANGSEVLIWLSKSVKWSEGKLAEVVNEVKSCLTDEQCRVGETFWKDEEYFYSVEKLGMGLHIEAVVDPMLTRIDSNRLKKGIKEKVRKYGSAGLPLVVAVVTDELLAAGKSFDNVLNGSRCCHSRTKITTRSNDGLFEKLPSLSTVLQLNRNWGSGEWSFNEVLNNPSAAFPLPLDAFVPTSVL